MITGRGVLVMMAVAAVIGWNAVDWVDRLNRDIEVREAQKRHLQAEAFLDAIEARWGPPVRWTPAYEQFPADKEL